MSQQIDAEPPEEADDASYAYAQQPAWFQANVPEHYADTVNVNMGPYGMSLTFGIRGFNGPAPNSRVFMSHEMGLVLSRLLRRVLRTHELDNDVSIQVPDGILADLRLRLSDLDELETTAAQSDHVKGSAQ